MVIQRPKHLPRHWSMIVFMMMLLLPTNWRTVSSSSMLMVHAFSSVPSTYRYLSATATTTSMAQQRRRKHPQHHSLEGCASRTIRKSFAPLTSAASSTSSETDPPPPPPRVLSPSPSCGWMTKLMTGVSHPQQPAWAPSWMPTGWVRLRPTLQLLIVLLAYIFHMTVLAQHSISFPIQLIPNDKGHFQNIGWDSIAGMVTMAVYYWLQSTTVLPSTSLITSNHTTKTVFPKLWSTPSLFEAPWKNIYRSKYSRITSFLGLCALIQAYFWTGRFSLWWEDTFFYLANFYPITVAMHRSLCVLFGHLSWIVLGGSVLRLVPRPQSFFDNNTWYTLRTTRQDTHSDDKDEVDPTGTTTSTSTTGTRRHGDDGGAPQWVWWTIGGYFVSSWLFNIADVINQWVLPAAILEQAQDSVVSQLINPESNDWWASLVGYIAPCITAPWWEEVLYRGFLLPALVLQMKYKWAVLWSGIIFAVHHLSPTACIPLTILGWTWSLLYVKSGNLLTTVLIHAMWNSRIFLGSWLGL